MHILNIKGKYDTSQLCVLFCLQLFYLGHNHVPFEHYTMVQLCITLCGLHLELVFLSFIILYKLSYFTWILI